jgi:hypothetical protein
MLYQLQKRLEATVSNDKAVLNDVARSDFSFGKIPEVPEGTKERDEEDYYSSRSPNSGPFKYIA